MFIYIYQMYNYEKCYGIQVHSTMGPSTREETWRWGRFGKGGKWKHSGRLNSTWKRPVVGRSMMKYKEVKKLIMAVVLGQWRTLWTILRSLLSSSFRVPESHYEDFSIEKITLTSVDWSSVSVLVFVSRLLRRLYQACRKGVVDTFS